VNRLLTATQGQPPNPVQSKQFEPKNLQMKLTTRATTQTMPLLILAPNKGKFHNLHRCWLWLLLLLPIFRIAEGLSWMGTTSGFGADDGVWHGGGVANDGVALTCECNSRP